MMCMACTAQTLAQNCSTDGNDEEVSSRARGLIQEEAEADVCPFQAPETTSYQRTPRFFKDCVNISTWGSILRV